MICENGSPCMSNLWAICQRERSKRSRILSLDVHDNHTVQRRVLMISVQFFISFADCSCSLSILFIMRFRRALSKRRGISPASNIQGGVGTLLGVSDRWEAIGYGFRSPGFLAFDRNSKTTESHESLVLQFGQLPPWGSAA